MTSVLVVSGPDLGRASGRTPEVAAHGLAADLERTLIELDPSITVHFRQTDDEAQLVSWLHEAVEGGWGVVLNPSAFTHYSYALRDAAAAVTADGLPLVEVHLTNPAPSGESRPGSVVSRVSTGIIAGLGFDSYRFAVRAAADRVAGRAARAAVAGAAGAREMA